MANQVRLPTNDNLVVFPLPTWYSTVVSLGLYLYDVISTALSLRYVAFCSIHSDSLMEMETISTTIPAPDNADTIFDAVIEVAYSYTDPVAVDRGELRIEGRSLKTGLSSAQLPYRITVLPVGEDAAEIYLEIDIEDRSDRQVQAKDLLLGVFRDQTPREYDKRRAGVATTPTPSVSDPSPTLFDRIGPLDLAEFFKYATIPIGILGVLVIIVSISLFATASAILRPSPWVVILTLGGEIFATAVVAGILLFFGYVLELLTHTRDILAKSNDPSPRG